MSRSDRWDDLDRDMDQMIATVLAMSEEQRHTPAVKGGFTPAETIEHMAMAEAYYLPMIQKTTLKGLRGRAAKTSFLFPFVVRKLASAQPVPTMKEMTPAEAKPDPERAADHWRQVRKKMRDATSDLDDDATALKHPLFGLMGPADIIEINTAHMMYHRKRI